MNWKKLIEKGSTPQVGNIYKLKSVTYTGDWSDGVFERYEGRNLEIKKIVDDYCILEDRWHVTFPFLKKHFTLVDIP